MNKTLIIRLRWLADISSIFIGKPARRVTIDYSLAAAGTRSVRCNCWYRTIGCRWLFVCCWFNYLACLLIYWHFLLRCCPHPFVTRKTNNIAGWHRCSNISIFYRYFCPKLFIIVKVIKCLFSNQIFSRIVLAVTCLSCFVLLYL